jgi:ABC-2 type transport system ATP-binding protein
MFAEVIRYKALFLDRFALRPGQTSLMFSGACPACRRSGDALVSAKRSVDRNFKNYQGMVSNKVRLAKKLGTFFVWLCQRAYNCPYLISAEEDVFVIEVKNLTKMYGNLRAVDNISFSVQAGEIIGLLGPNGAGKTTTMRILTCFIPASTGSATIAGFDIFEDSMEVRRRIGYLPETPPLYPEMTVKSYLNFIAEIREIPSAKVRGRIDDVVSRTALSEHYTRIIGTLSKGFRQRVGLAQALLHDPEVLILDEPTVGLDPNQIIEIRSLIQNLAKDHTIVLSTHILPEVSMTCKRVVIINEGKIVAVDSVENLEKQGGDATTFRVELKPAGLDWKTSFEAVPGVRLEHEKTTGERVAFEMHLPNAAAYDKVFAAVVGKGHVFTEIAPSRASLEKVFLKLTKTEEAPVEERRQAA